MWICQKCNTQNTANFCMNCGASANIRSASELPPTVLGFQTPPPVPNRSEPENQPPFPPRQQQYQQQSAGFSPAAPAKSKAGLVIAGVVGLLIIVIGGGIALWFAVIGPYFTEQARLKKERDNQVRADSTTAVGLMPDGYFVRAGYEPEFLARGKIVDRTQLFQASQNLPPEIRSELKNINDAAAAQYAGQTDPSRKIILQILKYSTPRQAALDCEKIGREFEKNKASFEEVVFFPTNDYLPTNCHTSAVEKSKSYTGISTMYGFLIIYAGHKDNDPAAVKEMILRKLSEGKWF